jgi:hypothetical protein
MKQPVLSSMLSLTGPRIVRLEGFKVHLQRLFLLLIVVAAPAIAAASPTAVASPVRFFPETGFAITNPSVQDYFDKRGGVQTFGYPVSREFRLLGFPVQMFQRAIFQRYPDEHIQLLNLLDSGLFPYSQVNGAVLPAADPNLIATAPAVDSDNYGLAC